VTHAVATHAPPLPLGFRIELDGDVKPLRGGGWFGGSPTRVLRLTEDGSAAWDELRAGPVSSRRAGMLARRLIDAGIAHPVPQQPSAAPDVTVVIPVRDRVVELDQCLTSLASAYPVVVVDDASAGGSAIRAVATRHGARLIRLEQHAHQAAARNVGTAQAETELVAYVDSDTIPGVGWIAALAAHFADPAVAAVAPRVVPVADRSMVGRYTTARCNLDLGPKPARVVPYGRVSYLPTAALLVRRSAVLQVAGPRGVFDPDLLTGEDVDLIWRLHHAGWRIRYEPSQRISHQEPTTWGAILRRRRRAGTSTSLLAVRHPEAMTHLFIYPYAAACAVAVAARRPGLALAAFVASAGRLRRTLRRAGVADPELSATVLARGTAEAAMHSWIGIGRYLIHFAPWLLGLGLLHQRTRLPAAGLALCPALSDWRHRHAPIDPITFSVGYLVNEVAYGTGVLSGCVHERTTVPLRPVLIRRSP
jgi:mycofactocin system glycosyltransferase